MTGRADLALRVATGAAGIGVAGYGAVLLTGLGWPNLVATVVWAVGGIVVHDAVLAPLTIAVSWLAVRASGRRLPAPVVVCAIVLATVTVAAVPVLGRFGARPDNPTLLDRPYGAGWLAFTGLTLLLTLLGLLVGRLRRSGTAPRGGGRGAGAGSG